jgi:hypothetical protein
MLRVLTAVVILCSYLEIKISLPLLTARLPTNSNPAGVPVGLVIENGLWINLFLQLLISGLLLAVPYVGAWYPGAVHFGWRHLSDYTPRQRERIMPLLQDMMGLSSLLVSLCFGFCNHLRIQSALSSGPRLPADWFGHVISSELQVMAGLVVGLVVVTFYYVARFDAKAGAE